MLDKIKALVTRALSSEPIVILNAVAGFLAAVHQVATDELSTSDGWWGLAWAAAVVLMRQTVTPASGR